MSADSHHIAMRKACAEARKWLGATSPNPPVGAVALDASGKILAIAAHRRAGSAHAEAALIDDCRRQGLLDRVHTLCVTLAPCNHTGRTPPCCNAILEAGLRHVVVGTRDPNTGLKNDGIDRLEAAGVNVTLGVEEEMCRQLSYAFAYSVATGKPWITLKRALGAKGSMIPPEGEKTFTSVSSLRLAHLLRKRADAILTGSGTVLADNPSFTVRHVPDFAGKRRILAILDRRKRVSAPWLKNAETRGLLPLVYDNLDAAIDDLAYRGVREILVEAGPLLSQALIRRGLWTMDVAIHKGEPNDSVEVAFNRDVALPFDPEQWTWPNVLPA